MISGYPSLCIEYNDGKCVDESCPRIHLCRRFVLRGNCTVPGGCSLNHQLILKDVTLLRAYGLTQNTPNWMQVLRQFHMQTTSESYIERYYERKQVSTYQNQNLQGNSLRLLRKSMSGKQSVVTFFAEKSVKVSGSYNLNPGFMNSSTMSTTSSSMSSCATETSLLSMTDASNESMNVSRPRTKSPLRAINKGFGVSEDLSRVFSPLKLGEALDLPVLRQRPISPMEETRDIAQKLNAVEQYSRWQICVHYLNNNCGLGTKCEFNHPKSRRSYSWIYQFDDETTWYSLDAESNDALEAAYCDPNRNEVLNFTLLDTQSKKVQVCITFLNYIVADSISEPIRSAQLHRLGVNEGDEKNWVWYWLEIACNPPQWISYGMESNDARHGITSREIESFYKKMQYDTTEEIEITAGLKKGYVLNLRRSTVYDGFPFLEESVDGTIRPVCRRPKYKVTLQKSLPSPLKWPTLCPSHPTFPCANKECPMFGYKGSYLWVACKLGDPKWSLVDVDVGRNLELLFIDPHCSYTSIVWEKVKCSLFFTNTGKVDSSMTPGIRVERLHYDSQLWNWYGKDPTSFQTESWVSRLSLFPEIVSKLFQRLNTSSWRDLFNMSREFWTSLSNEECGKSNWHDLVEQQYKLFSSGSPTLDFLNFKDMLFNMGGKIIPVCRRPFIDSFRESELAKTQCNIIPATWLSKSGFSYPILEPGLSEEYRIIANLVLLKLPGASFLQICRIENHNLWKLYCVKRQDMLKKLGKLELNEALLFHGTSPQSGLKIAQNNFDFRLSGDRFGTLFGCGSYFTPDFNLALHYANRLTAGTNDKVNCIMVGLVLLGKSTVGHPSFKRPPPKNSEGDLFDSCTGHNISPPQAIIFDHNQMYPMFMILVSK